MAKPSNVMFVADGERNLWISITKDPDVTLMLEERDLGRELKIVRLETFDTIKEAIGRMRALTKMNRQRRRRVVDRSNPDWRHLSFAPRVPVTPSGVHPLSGSGDRGDDAAGGVRARIFAPSGPRSGADAKTPPRD